MLNLGDGDPRSGAGPHSQATQQVHGDVLASTQLHSRYLFLCARSPARLGELAHMMSSLGWRLNKGSFL